MYYKGANPRKIFSPCQMNGELFQSFRVEYIERNKNSKADELAKVAARNTPLSADIFFQVFDDALVKMVEPEPRLINVIEGEDSCAPMMAYLHHYYEPYNTTKHIRMQQRAKATRESIMTCTRLLSLVLSFDS
jgi:hypothetical protein